MKKEILTGTFISTGRGFGFVELEDNIVDIFIPPDMTKIAWMEILLRLK